MIDERVRLAFFTKRPFKSCWLEIHSPEGAEPDSLYRALHAIGWTEDQIPPPPPINFSELVGDVDYLVIERHFHKPGSGLFRGWTPDEKQRFMADARSLLRAFGFARVPTHKLRPEDLL